MSKIVYQIIERIGQTDKWVPVGFEETLAAAEQKKIDLRGLTSKQFKIQEMVVQETADESPKSLISMDPFLVDKPQE